MLQSFRKHKKIRFELIDYLSQYSAYDYEKGNQNNLEEEAKKGLLIFLEKFASLKVNATEYNSGRFHTSYLLQLIPVEKALKMNQYRLACHELQTLLYYEPFLQPRIYYNVIDLLKRNLE